MAPVRVAPSRTFNDLGIEVGSKKAIQRDLYKYTLPDLVTVSFTWDPKCFASRRYSIHSFSSDITIKTDE